jgi:GNAT superfamily N-acetyltransferase
VPVRHLAHVVDLARDYASSVLTRKATLLRARERDRWALIKWLETSMTAGPGPEPTPKDLTYRRATIRDCAAVAEVNVRSWRESFAGIRPRSSLESMSVKQRTAMFRRRFAAESYRMFVAEVSGLGVIGFADVGKPRDSSAYDAELYAIYILKEFQGKGIGRKLFDLVVQTVLAGEMNSLYLIVLEDSPYRAFYEKLGGCQVAQRPAGVAGREDACVAYAWKDLRGSVVA